MTYRELLNLYKQGKLDEVRYQNFLIWRVRMQRIRKIKNG